MIRGAPGYQRLPTSATGPQTRLQAATGAPAASQPWEHTSAVPSGTRCVRECCRSRPRPTASGAGRRPAVRVCAGQADAGPRSRTQPTATHCRRRCCWAPPTCGARCHCAPRRPPAGIGRGRERCVQVWRVGDAGLADGHGAQSSAGRGVALRTTARMAGTSKGAQPPCNPLGLPDAACHLTCNSPWLAVLLQEDAHAAILDLPDGSSKGALFAVLDGHGGAEVARFVANHLVRLRAGRRLCSNGLDPTRKCVSSSPG